MSHSNFWLIHWVSSRLNRPFSYPACRKWSPFSPSISLSTSSHCLSLGHWPNYVGRSLNFTCKTITKLKQYSTKRKASNDVFTLNQPLTHKPFIILSSVFSLGTFMRLSSGTFSTFNLLILGLKVASICFFATFGPIHRKSTRKYIKRFKSDGHRLCKKLILMRHGWYWNEDIALMKHMCRYLSWLWCDTEVRF